MNLFRAILKRLATNDFLWSLLTPFAKCYELMKRVRMQRSYELQAKKDMTYYHEKFSDIIEARVVLHGPFKGLKYPFVDSFGSALYPKFLGSYERELHSVLDDICNKNYSTVINIGCGEGYYAIGLARRIPSASIVAFDLSEEARRLTAEMAAANDVVNRVSIYTHCTAEFMESFDFSGNALIVCDCEGGEKLIFNRQNRDNIRGCDLLIEIHDFVDITISTYLRDLFEETHSIEIVKSIDDIEKAKTYEFPEAARHDLATRKYLFREGRPAIMEWYYLKPRD